MEQLLNEIIEIHLIPLLTSIDLLNFALTNKLYYSLSRNQLKINKEKKVSLRMKRLLSRLESLESRVKIHK